MFWKLLIQKVLKVNIIGNFYHELMQRPWNSRKKYLTFWKIIWKLNKTGASLHVGVNVWIRHLRRTTWSWRFSRNSDTLSQMFLSWNLLNMVLYKFDFNWDVTSWIILNTRTKLNIAFTKSTPFECTQKLFYQNDLWHSE
jgi:hypothetical protein